MAQKFQPIRGTKDLLVDDQRIFDHILNAATKVLKTANFSHISVPIIEFTEVFARSMGVSSDVVSKEMYSFNDRNDESLTLRPEFTAGIARSVISNGLSQNLPLRVFTSGPLFRYERPQKGRQRQFHQLDVEIIGVKSALSDAEAIILGDRVLKAIGIDDFDIEINSLGDNESRQNYRQLLVDYFSKYKADLSEDSKKRLELNPLRILDSKDENDQKIAVNAPKIRESLNKTSLEFFDDLCNLLDKQEDINFTINQSIVRGLDYYTHTCFEFKTNSLGAQNTLLAGGRYDGLIKQLGGPETPAIGWAAGLERLMIMLENKQIAQQNLVAEILVSSSDYFSNALNLAEKLRLNNISCEVASQTNIGKAFKQADKNNAKFAIIIGDDEVKSKTYSLKNLSSGEQIQCKYSELAGLLSASR